MNDNMELLLKTYKPEVAIVVYGSRTVHNDYYLESHTFNEAGGLMEGKPLMEETLNSMVDVFFDERQNRLRVSGFIPENIVSFELLPGGSCHMTWYRPAEIRVMHFAAALKLNTGKMWVPAMYYVVNRNSLYVFATKKSGRPDMNTVLYRAPFFNVSDNGSVCLGSAQVKKPTIHSYENLMKYWEDLFWLSKFSHLNGATNPTKSDLSDVYKKLLKSKTKLKWSDIDELKTNGKKVKSIFK